MSKVNTENENVIELQIAIRQREMEAARSKIVDLCRKRGTQYAEIDSSYEDEGFIVINGCRVNADAIDDKSIEVKGETIAYVDKLSGRVVYVNPDARWDNACQTIISQKVSEIQSDIKKNERKAEGCLIATNIAWSVYDDTLCTLWDELPDNVIIPEGISADNVVEYLSDRFECHIDNLDIITAATEEYGK